MYDVQIVFPASERNQVIRKLSPLSVLSQDSTVCIRHLTLAPLSMWNDLEVRIHVKEGHKVLCSLPLPNKNPHL